MTITEALKALDALEAELRAYNHALGVMNFNSRVTTNYNGKAKSATKSFAELVASNGSGVYYFEAADMAAADVQTDVTLTVEKAGSPIAAVTDSIASYCARVYASHAETRDLTDAMLIYGLSARDYFFEPLMVREENEMPAN